MHVPLNATLQTSFSQTSRWTSSNVRTREPRAAPDLGGRLDSRRHRAAALAEPDQLEAVVMRVPGCDDRGAESAGDADGHPVLAEDACGNVRAAEAVLDREHQRVRPDQRSRSLGRGLDVHRLGRQDHELRLAGLGRVGRRLDRDDAVAARPLDPQAALADRLDVLLPDVDRPDLVSGAAEQARIDRAHRAGADDCDLHECDDRGMERVTLFWQPA